VAAGTAVCEKRNDGDEGGYGDEEIG